MYQPEDRHIPFLLQDHNIKPDPLLLLAAKRERLPMGIKFQCKFYDPYITVIVVSNQ